MNQIEYEFLLLTFYYKFLNLKEKIDETFSWLRNNFEAICLDQIRKANKHLLQEKEKENKNLKFDFRSAQLKLNLIKEKKDHFYYDHLMEGCFLIELKRYDEAIVAFKHILNKTIRNEEHRQALLRNLLCLLLTYLLKNDIQSAKEQLEDIFSRQQPFFGVGQSTFIQDYVINNNASVFFFNLI